MTISETMPMNINILLNIGNIFFQNGTIYTTKVSEFEWEGNVQ